MMDVSMILYRCRGCTCGIVNQLVVAALGELLRLELHTRWRVAHVDDENILHGTVGSEWSPASALDNEEDIRSFSAVVDTTLSLPPSAAEDGESVRAVLESTNTLAADAAEPKVVILHVNAMSTVVSRILPLGVPANALYFIDLQEACRCHGSQKTSLFARRNDVNTVYQTIDANSLLLRATTYNFISRRWFDDLCPRSARASLSGSPSTKSWSLQSSSTPSRPKHRSSSPPSNKDTAEAGGLKASGVNGQRALEALMGYPKPVKQALVLPGKRRSRRQAVQGSPPKRGSDTPLERKKVGFESPTASALRVVRRLSRTLEPVAMDHTMVLNRYMLDETPQKATQPPLDSLSSMDDTASESVNPRGILFANADDGLSAAVSRVPSVNERMLLASNGMLGPKVAAAFASNAKGHLSPMLAADQSYHADATLQAALSSDPALAAWWMSYTCSWAGKHHSPESLDGEMDFAALDKHAHAGIADVQAVRQLHNRHKGLNMGVSSATDLTPSRLGNALERVFMEADVCSSTTPRKGLILPQRVFDRLQQFAREYALPPRMQAVIDRLIHSFFVMADPSTAIQRTCMEPVCTKLLKEVMVDEKEPPAPAWMLCPRADVRKFFTNDVPAAVALLSSFEYNLRSIAPGLSESPGRASDTGISRIGGVVSVTTTPSSTRLFASPSRRALQAVSQAFFASPPRSLSCKSDHTSTFKRLEAEGKAVWPAIPLWWPEAADAVREQADGLVGPYIANMLVLQALKDVVLAGLDDSDFASMETDATTIQPAEPRKRRNKRSAGPWAKLFEKDKQVAEIPSKVRCRFRTLCMLGVFFESSLTQPSAQVISLDEVNRRKIHALSADMCFLIGASATVASSGLLYMMQQKQLGSVARYFELTFESLITAFPGDIAALYVARGMTVPEHINGICRDLGVTIPEPVAETVTGHKRKRPTSTANTAVERPEDSAHHEEAVPEEVHAELLQSPPRKVRQSSPIEDPTAIMPLESASIAKTVISEPPSTITEPPARVQWGLVRGLAPRQPSSSEMSTLSQISSTIPPQPVAKPAPKAPREPLARSNENAANVATELLQDRKISNMLGRGSLVFLRRHTTSMTAASSKPRSKHK